MTDMRYDRGQHRHYRLQGFLHQRTPLDSLGFVMGRGRRPNLHKVNRVAKGRLQAVPVKRLTNNELSADNWFDHIVSPSFLGHTFSNGVHVMLVSTKGLRVLKHL